MTDVTLTIDNSHIFILVPLDGSRQAEAILSQVEELADCYHAEVIFLRVVEPESIIAGYDGLAPVLDRQKLERETKEAQAYLSARQGAFREKGIETRTCVVYGPVEGAIMETAERENVDLVAITSHGQNDLPRMLCGSVAAGILQRLDRPLLLVRSEAGMG